LRSRRKVPRFIDRNSHAISIAELGQLGRKALNERKPGPLDDDGPVERRRALARPVRLQRRGVYLVIGVTVRGDDDPRHGALVVREHEQAAVPDERMRAPARREDAEADAGGQGDEHGGDEGRHDGRDRRRVGAAAGGGGGDGDELEAAVGAAGIGPSGGELEGGTAGGGGPVAGAALEGDGAVEGCRPQPYDGVPQIGQMGIPPASVTASRSIQPSGSMRIVMGTTPSRAGRAAGPAA
jgi:hypothetical protein